MASLTIHDLDDTLTDRLRAQADGHGRSVEEEARDILVSVLACRTGRRGGPAASIRARFAAVGGVETADVAREGVRTPPSFEG